MIVHQSFSIQEDSTHENDIALLKLGELLTTPTELNQFYPMLNDQFSCSQYYTKDQMKTHFLLTEERVDLSKYTPVCLPKESDDFSAEVVTQGIVYGELN